MDKYTEMKEFYGQQETSLKDYLSVVFRRKWIIVAIALPIFTLVTLYSFLTRPMYTSKGTLLIENEPNILTFEEIFQIDSVALDYRHTQYKLLESRYLADGVLEKLGLYDNGEDGGKSGYASDNNNNREGTSKGNIIDWLLRTIKIKPARGSNSDELIQEYSDFVLKSELINWFIKQIKVKPIRDTRLVEVTFKHQDPVFSAQAVNTIFDTFISLNLKMKYDTTEQVKEFLTEQIQKLHKEIEDEENKLQIYGVEKDMIALSDNESIIVERLGELNSALTEAQIDRLRKETYYNEIRVVSPDNIPEALGNPLIQRLREEYSRLKREYTKKQETFLPDYPEMLRLKAELESAENSLQMETEGLIKGAYLDYQAALNKERSLRGVFNKQKQEAIKLNSNAILYNSQTIEIDNKKNLLNSLLKRQSETGVSAQLKGLKTTNARVVDKAEVPLNPSSPKKALNMVLALAFGLFGGIGLAFLLDYMDDSIKTFDDIEKYASLPLLGFIPKFSEDKIANSFREKQAIPSGKRLLIPGQGIQNKEDLKNITSIELIPHLLPESNFSEHYRTIRTALLLSTANGNLKTIAVSSPLEQEGKTTTLSNLAITFAQQNKSVLIVDTDLRRPRLHKVFKIKNTMGLTNYLTSQLALKDIESLVKDTKVPNLYLLNAGPIPPDPIELISSVKMARLIDNMEECFDYVLFDTPPALAVSDSMVLGQRIDGMILAVWGGRTPKELLKRTKDKMIHYRIKTFGVIINNFDFREYGYSYYHYQY